MPGKKLETKEAALQLWCDQNPDDPPIVPYQSGEEPMARIAIWNEKHLYFIPG